MKKNIIILAALIAIAISCAKTDVPQVKQNQTFTLTATVSGDSENINVATGTRIGFEEINNGRSISVKFEEDDELSVAFIQGEHVFTAKAGVIPGSISENGKTANFEITLPSDPNFDEDQPFNLRCIYGEIRSFNNSGFSLIRNHYERIALEGNNKINPLFLFKADGVTKIKLLEGIKIKLEHLGYVVAVHIKNISDTSQKVPERVIIGSRFTFMLWISDFNDYVFSSDSWKYPVNDYSIVYGSTADFGYPEITLAPGEVHTYYRWTLHLGITDIPEVRGSFWSEKSYVMLAFRNTIPPKQNLLYPGKCLHVYVTYNGQSMHFDAH